VGTAQTEPGVGQARHTAFAEVGAQRPLLDQHLAQLGGLRV